MTRTLILLGVLACAGNPGPSPTPRGSASAAAGSEIRIESHPPDRFEAIVSRELGAIPGVGHVVVRAPDRAAVEHSPHLRLAGARAWLQVAKTLQSDAKLADASTAATKGLAELGRDYRPQNVEDDTSLHLHAADDAAEHGRLDEATAARIGVLGSRIELYLKRYAADVQ